MLLPSCQNSSMLTFSKPETFLVEQGYCCIRRYVNVPPPHHEKMTFVHYHDHTQFHTHILLFIVDIFLVFLFFFSPSFSIAGWEAIFVACNRSGKLLTIEDRKDTCIGICHVLASLPNDQQQTSLMALALASIACLEAMVIRAADFSNTASATLSATLDRAADEIIILATTARAYTDAVSAMTISGVVCSGRPNIVEPSMTVLRRAWSTISIAASKFSFHDVRKKMKNSTYII